MSDATNLVGRSSDNSVEAVRAHHIGRGLGLFSRSEEFIAVFASSGNNIAVLGDNVGFQDFLPAIEGRSRGGPGVRGRSEGEQAGVAGISKGFAGVLAETASDHPAFIAVSKGSKKKAGRFEGSVEVTDNLQVAGSVKVAGELLVAGADVAEQFDVTSMLGDADEVGPGTVVVLDHEGALTPCTQAYDRCVAGVVSGAGDRVPALVLDRREHPEAGEGTWRRAVAVVGKVWCRANASSQPIRAGDLLTTSSMRGHAMVAANRDEAFGAVLGKALTPLTSGTGMVLALVGLA
jgi:hypothetical protein